MVTKMENVMAAITYRAADVDGFKVAYREAGLVGAPKLLLLHGFPSAGHMFRDLIPLLADRFHIVAPDLPGFGQSDMPSRESFRYTFDNLPLAIEGVTGHDRRSFNFPGLHAYGIGRPIEGRRCGAIAGVVRFTQ